MVVNYDVQYHPMVVRQNIPALYTAWKKRIKSAIENKLFTAPEIFGIPLRKSLKGHRKLRVGDYRIVFRLEQKTVFILAILHRSTIYEQMETRAHGL